jgi:hypothetical protein
VKKLLAATIGLALLGLATGCGTTSKDDAGSTPTTTISKPAATAPAGPLTAAQYQASLTQLDQQLAPAIKALGTANNGDNLASAMTELSQQLSSGASSLAAVKPPAAAVAAHKTLQARLNAASSALEGSKADDAVTNAKCGGVVYTSQNMQRKLAADLASAVAQLKKVGIRFGSTLPNLGPEPADQRPSNGDIIVRSGARGSGRLEVENGTDKDVALSVVTDGQPPGKPHLMIFVQAKKTATASRIGGKYHIYYKTGTDWNAKRRQFSSDCSFSKFDQGFGKNEGWKIGLKPSIAGNASTSDVDAF